MLFSRASSVALLVGIQVDTGFFRIKSFYTNPIKICDVADWRMQGNVKPVPTTCMYILTA